MLLNAPRCPREIRERIAGAKRKRVEAAVHRLRDEGLIRCVTHELLQSRMYGRTIMGDRLVERLTGEPVKPSHTLTIDEIRLRAWISAGRYRRLVLRAMVETMTPKQIRRRVLPMYERIGINHVHGVLREFAERSVARVDPWRHWRLTPLGMRLREVEMDGLPPLPGPVTGWGRWVRRQPE